VPNTFSVTIVAAGNYVVLMSRIENLFFVFLKGQLMTHKLFRHRVLTAAILTLAVSTSIWPGTATAQENDGWKFRISPYL
jgi:hypothetical protein